MRKKKKSGLKTFINKVCPDMLDDAIKTIMLKFSLGEEENRQKIEVMLKDLLEAKEFERLIHYNKIDEDEDGFRIKDKFINQKYEQEKATLRYLIRSRDGVLDRVVQRIKDYNENLNKKSKITLSLEKVHDYQDFPEFKPTR